jgi:WD repeat-containing protein mio
MLKTDTLIECGKCRHGGHVNHVVKWFEEYENCPHIGCPCLCN